MMPMKLKRKRPSEKPCTAPYWTRYNVLDTVQCPHCDRPMTRVVRPNKRGQTCEPCEYAIVRIGGNGER